MIHARKDYDRIQDPSGKIPEDEPVFLLRGQDVFAPELLLRWASKLRLSWGDPAMARMVEDHAQLMIKWQGKHGRKVPDLPDDYKTSEVDFEDAPLSKDNDDFDF